MAKTEHSYIERVFLIDLHMMGVVQRNTYSP